MEWDKGAILVADALGVKGIWARINPSLVVESWRSVIDSVEAAAKERELDFTNSVKQWRIEHSYQGYTLQAFSDTLIAAVRDTSRPSALWWLTSIAHRAFVTALARGIYFRGVISLGEFFGSPKDKLLIGPAVDEAAEWANKPDWIGISTAPSALFEMDLLKTPTETRLLKSRGR